MLHVLLLLCCHARNAHAHCIARANACARHSPRDFHSLGPLAPKPYTYKLIGMLGAILSASTIILVGYMAVGVAGYMAYPLTVSSNVLNSFPSNDVALQVRARACGFRTPHAHACVRAARAAAACTGLCAAHWLWVCVHACSDDAACPCRWLAS